MACSSNSNTRNNMVVKSVRFFYERMGVLAESETGMPAQSLSQVRSANNNNVATSEPRVEAAPENEEPVKATTLQTPVQEHQPQVSLSVNEITQCLFKDNLYTDKYLVSKCALIIASGSFISGAFVHIDRKSVV